ncbi:MAG: hypothetical protein EXS37_21325 [Opitutus sp.]|nr:hypothetical protein [Opitutus sp.]
MKLSHVLLASSLAANAALSATERAAQFADLANRAKADLLRQLGTEGADIYGRQAGWLRLLQASTAFTTSSNARLLPPGSARPFGPVTAMPPSQPPKPAPTPKATSP